MSLLDDLNVQIFADGADLAGMTAMARDPRISGFTTNPTLMRKAGVQDYRSFAREVVAAIPDRPISFEVFSDDLGEMIDQGREIATWGENVNVKIPVTNTAGEFTGRVVSDLSGAGVKVNVTALFTVAQVERVIASLRGESEAFISVFAGRIADTGRDPSPIMAEAMTCLSSRPGTRLIWASPRELYNIFQADQVGCDIITVANNLLEKLPLVGKDLDQFSLETVEMFRKDAVAAGFSIN